MTDYIQRSRSDFTVKFSLCTFLILICVSIFLCLFGPSLYKDLQKEVLYSLILFGILPVTTYAVFINTFMIYIEETEDVHSAFLKCISDFWKNEKFLLLVLILLTAAKAWCIISFFHAFIFKQSSLFLEGIAVLFFVSYFAAALLLILVFRLSDYDDAEISSMQNSEKSIGALWASGAYNSYYKIALNDIMDRFKAFEKDKSITIELKKFIIICPLSCKVNGSLEEADEHITYVGHLKPIFDDQGGNANRMYKQSVYAIRVNEESVVHVVAEYASPLATLWGRRHSMHKSKLIYIRDCLVNTLKDILKDYKNVVVLEYDDQNPDSILSQFLLSSVEKLVQLEQNQKKNYCRIGM